MTFNRRCVHAVKLLRDSQLMRTKPIPSHCTDCGATSVALPLEATYRSVRFRTRTILRKAAPRTRDTLSLAAVLCDLMKGFLDNKSALFVLDLTGCSISYASSNSSRSLISLELTVEASGASPKAGCRAKKFPKTVVFSFRGIVAKPEYWGFFSPRVKV